VANHSGAIHGRLTNRVVIALPTWFPIGRKGSCLNLNSGRVYFLTIMTYTFGDTEQPSRRLRRLAQIYEPETRALLASVLEFREVRDLVMAVDLGCGPGWSTQLLSAVLKPKRTIGLELSERYVAEARANHPHLEFRQHDIVHLPFPVESADLLFCRFLLTHLQSPSAALDAWAQLAAPRTILVIHETESLQACDPALSRYYELVGEMQRHYGQQLNIGAILDATFEGTPWKVRRREGIVQEKSAREMAQLHLPNLRTWCRNEYASQAFDRREIEELDLALDRIASGMLDSGVVRNLARQIVAERL
jgi:trans-aconitate 2-methyltransferase